MIRTLIYIFACALFLTSQKAPQKVFVIGDSISIQYGPYLASFLGEKYVYDRLRKAGTPFASRDSIPIANGQDSKNVLKQVKRLLADPSFQPDVFLVNCGLHDIKTLVETQKKQVPLPEYISNLDSIFHLLQEREIRTVWVRTTPVVDSIHNKEGMSFHRYATDLDQYNKMADILCSALSIPQIDLHHFTLSLGRDIYVDHVHFDREVRKLQGAFVAGYLLSL